MKRRLGWIGLLGSVACVIGTPSGQDEGASTTSTTGPTSSNDGATATTTIDLDTTATETGADTSTTTGAPQPCMSDDDCMDPAAPFCSPLLQECVSCSGIPDPEAACTSLDPALPACVDGACVQCSADVTTQCTGAAPICDQATNTCMPCTVHEQCGAAACNLFTGACVEGPVVTVGPAGQDHLTLTAAVNALAAGGGGTIVVFQGTYDEAVTVDGGTIVAFLVNGSDRPVWQRTTGVAAPQLQVLAGTTVLMEGFDLRLNTAVVSPAIYADGSSLWLDRTVIAQNDGVALSAENTTNAVLRNCMVGGSPDLPVLSATNSSIVVQYSTVGASPGDATAITCDAGSLVEVSDSIIVSRGVGPEVECMPLAATHTASNTALPGGMDNVEVGPTMTAWFVSYNEGNFHLTPGGGEPIFMSVAEWNDGDPLVDIDGEARSGVDGTSEHAGADVP